MSSLFQWCPNGGEKEQQNRFFLLLKQNDVELKVMIAVVALLLVETYQYPVGPSRSRDTMMTPAVSGIPTTVGSRIQSYFPKVTRLLKATITKADTAMIDTMMPWAIAKVCNENLDQVNSDIPLLFKTSTDGHISGSRTPAQNKVKYTQQKWW